MHCSCFAPLLVATLTCFASAEFFSDVDSTEQDQKKALEIKAQDFWQGMMKSVQFLETTENAKLGADVERDVEKLSSEDNDLRELFHESIGHLARADSILFAEAAQFKELAHERLSNGPSCEAFLERSSSWDNVFVTAYRRFVGKGTYENQVARHIISRLKDIKPTLHNVPEMVPQMYAESSKASDKAYELLRSRDDGTKGDLPMNLRVLAHRIISATGKQRLRYVNYLLNSLMTTAEDIASKNEAPAKTLVKASLRGIEHEHERPNAIEHEHERPNATPPVLEHKLIFYDGVPVDAEPLQGGVNIQSVVDV